MNRTKNAVRNIVWGFINKFVVSLLPFASRTIVIYVLGTLYLGVGSLFSSILGMLSLAELGFSAAVVYSMYKPMAEKNVEKVCALLNFYRKCYRIIGCVILGLGVLLLPFLRLLIYGEYPSNINIYLIYFMYLINTVISYWLFAYKRSLLQANQRNDVESKVATVTTIIQYVIQIAVLLVFRNYYIFVLIMVGTTVINNLFVSRIVDHLYPEYVCIGNLSKSDYNGLKKQLKGLIYRKFGDVVLGSVDNIVISTFLGLTYVAMYGNYYAIVSILFGGISIISTALKNGIGNAVARETEQYLYKTFKILNLLYVLMVAVMSICFLCLVQPFMKLWVGDTLMFGSGMTILFTIYIFISKWCDVLYVYQEAYGIWWSTRFIPIIAAGTNLIINIILVNTIGIEGILISTIISVLFVYDFGYAWILFRICFKEQGSKWEYISRQLYYLCVFLVAACICVLISMKGPQNGVGCLLYRGLISIVVSPLVLLLGVYRLPEFSGVVSYVKRMVKG